MRRGVVGLESERLVGLVSIERLLAADAKAGGEDIMAGYPIRSAPPGEWWTATNAAWRWSTPTAGPGADPAVPGAGSCSSRTKRALRAWGAISPGRHARGAAGEPVAQRPWHRLPGLLVGVLGAVAATRPLAALDGPAPGTAPL